jgi:hypothetical protein
MEIIGGRCGAAAFFFAAAFVGAGAGDGFGSCCALTAMPIAAKTGNRILAMIFIPQIAYWRKKRRTRSISKFL